jgi:tetratricopeptide (TPR) repeat protein
VAPQAAQTAAARHAGNCHFRAKRWGDAVACYTEGLELGVVTDTHVLLANRSAAHLRAGRAERALADAELAVHAQPGWAKAYYRRAVARSQVRACVHACMHNDELWPSVSQAQRSVGVFRLSTHSMTSTGLCCRRAASPSRHNWTCLFL